MVGAVWVGHLNVPIIQLLAPPGLVCGEFPKGIGILQQQQQQEEDVRARSVPAHPGLE